MSFGVINVGTTANDGTGDPLRSAYQKINANFAIIANNALLTGVNVALTGAVTATDTILQAFGRIEHRLAIDDSKISYPFSGSQTANRVLASPDGSSGTLGVRALVANDIPVLTLGKIGSVAAGRLAGRYTASTGVLQEVTLGSGFSLDPVTGLLSATSGTVTTLTVSNLAPIFTSLVTNPTTAPAVAYTLSDQAPNQVLVGPASGGSAPPSFRALVSADIPSLAAIYLPLAGGTLTNLLTLSANGVSFGSSVFLQQSANVVSMLNAANPQQLNIYGTFTDNLNYKRLSLYHSAGDYVIEANALGTGTPTGDFYIRHLGNHAIRFWTSNTERWQIFNNGHFVAGTDNTLDIGQNGSRRPRIGYFGTSIVTPAIQITTGATNGYVLTSDAAGIGTWQAGTGGSGGLPTSGGTMTGDITINTNKLISTQNAVSTVLPNQKIIVANIIASGTHEVGSLRYGTTSVASSLGHNDLCGWQLVGTDSGTVNSFLAIFSGSGSVEFPGAQVTMDNDGTVEFGGGNIRFLPAGEIQTADMNLGGTLNITTALIFTAGAGAGKVLTSDGAGNATWALPSGAIPVANYAGVAPGYTPAGGGGVTVDSVTGQIWWYYGGTWQ